MYKAVCKVKKERENRFGAGKEVFYKYDIDGTEVVFVQSLVWDGGISCIEVRKSDKLKKAIRSMRIICMNPDETSYPIEVEIYTNGICYLKDVEQYIENVKYAKEIAQAIMDIFTEGSEHLELYQKTKG